MRLLALLLSLEQSLGYIRHGLLQCGRHHLHTLRQRVSLGSFLSRYILAQIHLVTLVASKPLAVVTDQ